MGVAGAALLLMGCMEKDTLHDHDHSNDAAATTVAEWKACKHILAGTPKEDSAFVPNSTTYDAAVDGLDMDAVKADMATLLKTSQACWPADHGNYAGLMIRLAWHCSGSYRKSDGVGGRTGGRQRFEPERSWPDNTNLDKARALLYPLKEKYGDALSWGDLIILAGTTAYRQAGMPVTRMCFGRMDEPDGSEAQLLGPTAEQESKFPCTVNGKCQAPLPTTVGLIYVNPEGPLNSNGDGQIADPALSVAEIRRTFETMGHTNRSTVALIGGGHAIGKAHGACAKSAGLSPKEAFASNGSQDIWKGQCGSGMGTDTTTSGIEGSWTTQPDQWDNEFFKDLFEKEWELWTGPGGAKQWRVKGMTGGLMRMTTDMALLEDPSFRAISQEFADNLTALTEAFDDAWDVLTTNGKGVWSNKAKCDDGSPAPSTVRRMRSDDIDFDFFV